MFKIFSLILAAITLQKKGVFSMELNAPQLNFLVGISVTTTGLSQSPNLVFWLQKWASRKAIRNPTIDIYVKTSRKQWADNDAYRGTPLLPIY